jgi:hypothetical protein
METEKAPKTTLSYLDSATLMNDVSFVARIKVACLTFANYILGEEPTVVAHNTRLKWAQACLAAPDNTARNIAPTVTMDPNVQAQGADISDADLQTATETAVNKTI